MRTVGEILKTTREQKNIALAEVEKTTKIKVNFLEILEKNDFGKINDATVVRGFIKNYAEYLGLSSKNILAIFRRDFAENKKGQILPRGVYEPLDQPKFSWTPKLTIAVSLGFVFLLLVFYLAFQVFSLLGAPSLGVSFPQEGEVFRINEIVMRGKTSHDATVAVNGEMALVLNDGSFEKTVHLSQGENKFFIEATSRRGKKTVREIIVRYENP